METAAARGREGWIWAWEKRTGEKKKGKKGAPSPNRGQWSASCGGSSGVGCVEARREASTRFELSGLIGLQSTPFILMCGIFWVTFFSSRRLVLLAGDRSQVDVANFSSILWWMDIYIYRASQVLSFSFLHIP